MIEIKGFLETSFVDWPGKICSVIFLPHCNFRCPYCHNHALIFNPEQYVSIPIEDILNRLSTLRDWIDGICVTGGEPTLQPRLSLLIREIKRHGFLVKLDTNGSNPEMLEQLIDAGEIDFVSMDVKAPLDPFSYRCAVGGTVDIDLILSSIELLKRGRVEYEFRMTVVPGVHKEDDILLLGRQLRVGRRLILQNFNPENPLDPLLKNVLPYDPEMLKRIEREIQGMMWPPESLSV
jgi:pyruvate formate lyase activating enzyme